jgi:hypothetical protein
MANPFAASESDAIKGRTLNLTLFSGLSAAIATAIVVFNESFEAIFGDNLTGAELAHTKLTLVIAIIAAFTLIAVADMLARAWASSANGRLIVTPVPGSPSAKTVDGDGFTIAAMRVKSDSPDEVEYLLAKAGAEPIWVPAAKVRLASGT